MPVSKIIFKKNMLHLKLKNVAISRGSGSTYEGLKAEFLHVSLDVADLLRAQIDEKEDPYNDPGIMMLEGSDRKIQILKAIRFLTGWKLQDANSFYEDLPRFIGTEDMLSITRDNAPLSPNMAIDEAVAALEKEGAKVAKVYEDRVPRTVLDLLKEKLTEALQQEVKDAG